MPRSQQSKESAIVAYFTTAPLEIAQLVHNLCRDALKARLTRSAEARERARATQKPAKAAKATKAAPVKVAPPAAPAAAPKKAKKRRKAKATKAVAAPAAEIEGGTYTEAELNDE